MCPHEVVQEIESSDEEMELDEPKESVLSTSVFGLSRSFALRIVDHPTSGMVKYVYRRFYFIDVLIVTVDNHIYSIFISTIVPRLMNFEEFYAKEHTFEDQIQNCSFQNILKYRQKTYYCTFRQQHQSASTWDQTSSQKQESGTRSRSTHVCQSPL